MDKILERVTNFAIIVATIVFIGVVTQRYFIVSKGSAALSVDMLIGKTLNLPDIQWAASHNTLIVVLQKNCPYCTASASFYRRLNEELSKQKNVSLIALLPSRVESSREYLKELEVPFKEIKEISLKSIDVAATPTLLLTDNTGKIVAGWVGKLSPAKELEVIETVIRLSAE